LTSPCSRKSPEPAARTAHARRAAARPLDCGAPTPAPFERRSRAPGGAAGHDHGPPTGSLAKPIGRTSRYECKAGAIFGAGSSTSWPLRSKQSAGNTWTPIRPQWRKHPVGSRGPPTVSRRTNPTPFHPELYFSPLIDSGPTRPHEIEPALAALRRDVYRAPVPPESLEFSSN